MGTTLGYAFGFVGAALMVASYTMKAMLPLRLAALAACACLVAYGAFMQALPTLLLVAALIPINIRKTVQLRRVIVDIEKARDNTPVSEWLLPHMTRREAKAGMLLWRRGDRADSMLYLYEGRLRLVEHDTLVEPGVLVGEIGLFGPDNRRTLSLRCETDCVLFALSAEQMQLLYFQSPRLGYHVMRLIVTRLMQDAERDRPVALPDPAAEGVGDAGLPSGAREVLDFWFGTPPAATPRAEWFRKDDGFDALIASRFSPLIEQALVGGLQEWERDPESALARIVVLDQFTRNAFRGTARAFAGDAQALAAAQALVARGWDRRLSPLQRWFAYLPYEHAEDIAVQEQSLRLFALLAAEHPKLADTLEWARRHHAVILRFGRYPHRNAALVRASTAEELAFLQQAGSSF